MKVKKFLDKSIYSYEFSSSSQLEKLLKEKRDCIKTEKIQNKTVISFETDEDFEILRLLVILSPIFIATFDSSENELEYFKNNLECSNFKFGLYENFFENFSKESYFDFYKNHPKNEDIIVNEDMTIDFSINELDDIYLLSLVEMIEKLIIDEKNRKKLLIYFKKIRNDIVINGRRSILANGIQAFYLSKYVLVWALDLYKLIGLNNSYIFLIYELTNNLKRPIKKP